MDEEKHHIIGYIKNSTDPEYVNGERLVLLNYKHTTHYPAMKECEEHFLLVTNTGKYFILNMSERAKTIT